MNACLDELESWRQRGWLRRLDIALARFCLDLSDTAVPDALMMAAALASRLEGLGHACLPLAELEGGEGAVFRWEAGTIAAIKTRWAALAAQAPDWHCHPLVGTGSPGETGTPFVFDRQRLYLRRLWTAETSIREHCHRLATSTCPPSPARQALAARWLDRFFPVRADAGIDWQRRACEVALEGQFTVITGGPGTGKTHTAARLYALWCLLQEHETPGRPLRIALSAPTGKAAGRLEQSITLALAALAALANQFADEWPVAARPEAVPRATTLHRLLGARGDTRRFRHDAGRPLDCDVLFVDEASMVDLTLMAAVLEALPPHGRLVLLGDKDQLASVEAGAVLADLCAAPPASPLNARIVALRHSHRFGGDIGTLAKAVNAGDAAAVEAAFVAGGTVECVVPAGPRQLLALALPASESATTEAGYLPYLRALQQRPAPEAAMAAFEEWVQGLMRAFDSFRVLCALNDGDWGVDELNRSIEAALRQRGFIQGDGDWYEGRPVMVTRNDATLGIANGDIGLVLRSPTGGQRVWFADGAQIRSVGLSRLSEVVPAFALTIHKSQGSEFGHVVVALGAEPHAGLTRELLYTGITRARQRVTVVGGGEEVLLRAVVRRTLRAGGLT